MLHHGKEKIEENFANSSAWTWNLSVRSKWISIFAFCLFLLLRENLQPWSTNEACITADEGGPKKIGSYFESKVLTTFLTFVLSKFCCPNSTNRQMNGNEKNVSGQMKNSKTFPFFLLFFMFSVSLFSHLNVLTQNGRHQSSKVNGVQLLATKTSMWQHCQLIQQQTN